jgi:hypothetical protein
VPGFYECPGLRTYQQTHADSSLSLFKQSEFHFFINLPEILFKCYKMLDKLILIGKSITNIEFWSDNGLKPASFTVIKATVNKILLQNVTIEP